MKHSSEFISYLGYRILFWKAMLDNDYEKSDYYTEEMNNILPKMNIGELLEILTIIEAIYSNRQ